MTGTRAARPATTLGLVGGALGTLAGVVELTVGASIRSWIGDKHDPTRLGLVTVALSLVALASALALLRRPGGSPARRAVLGFGLLLPGAICFTTVGRLWYVPGALLVAAGMLTLAALRREAGAVLAVAARNWIALLTGILGLLYLALGLTAQGLAGAFGIAGGLATIALITTRERLPLPRPLALGFLVAALAPFALATWWSIVTPLLALLTTSTATPALNHPAHLARRADPAGQRVVRLGCCRVRAARAAGRSA